MKDLPEICDHEIICIIIWGRKTKEYRSKEVRREDGKKERREEERKEGGREGVRNGGRGNVSAGEEKKK